MINHEDPSLENAVTGNYDFSVGKIISDAWHKVKGVKRYYWGAVALYFLIYLAVNVTLDLTFYLLTKTVLTGHVGGMVADAIQFAINITLVVFLFLPISAGILLINLRWVKLKKACVYYIFKFFQMEYILKFFTWWIIYSVFIGGFGLLAGVFFGMGAAVSSVLLKAFLITLGIIAVLAVIYFLVSFVFSIYLVIDRRLHGWRSLMSSLRAVGHHWFKTLWLLIVIGFFIAISAIPLGIGLIWSLPWSYNCMAEAYKTIFGIAGLDPVTSRQNQVQEA